MYQPVVIMCITIWEISLKWIVLTKYGMEKIINDLDRTCSEEYYLSGVRIVVIIGVKLKRALQERGDDLL